MAREGEHFYRGEKEVGRATVDKARQEESFFLLGSIIAGCERSPFWCPDSI